MYVGNIFLPGEKKDKDPEHSLNGVISETRCGTEVANLSCE